MTLRDPPRSDGRPRWLAPTAVVQAEMIEPALTGREWVLDAREPRAHAVLVLSRRATVAGGGEAVELVAPALLWLPVRIDRALRLEAGARAAMLSAAEDFVARTISGTAEAVPLRRAIGRVTIVPAPRLKAYTAEIAQSFQALAREIRAPDRGSLGILASHLSLICLHLWRLSTEGVAEEGAARGTGAHVLQGFLQLVELHYREHWSVARYAGALGVTEDRLHAVCTRGAGKAPTAVIHERLITEACDRLQKTDLPVEQIAFALGFRDPSYFSRFCRRVLGMPPGAYRRKTRARPDRPGSYAAWP